MPERQHPRLLDLWPVHINMLLHVYMHTPRIILFAYLFTLAHDNYKKKHFLAIIMLCREEEGVRLLERDQLHARLCSAPPLSSETYYQYRKVDVIAFFFF